MGKIFIGAGIALVILGLIWPALLKSGLGRLPGDIIIEKKNMTFYFPVMTSILISVILSLLLWLLSKRP